MKQSRLIIIFLLVGIINSNAQSFLAADQKPKYLPKNKAEDYLSFTVEQNDGMAKISMESMDNVRDCTFYVLKGLSDDRDGISWQIIAVFENQNKKSFHKIYNDKIEPARHTLYRIMVTDSEENIEYTPIKSPESSGTGSPITGT